MRSYLLLLSLATSAVAQPRPELVVTVRSETHPSWQNDFEQTLAPVAGRPVGEEPPTVRLQLARESQRGGYLLATNEVSGGFFGIDLFRPSGGDAVPTRLSFDYRADPSLKVNLLATVRHQDYEIGFTGPPSDTGKTVWLGQLPGVVADGTWRHLEVPLLRLIRQKVGFSTINLTSLRFENRHYGDYLVAGFGGNGAGTTLAIDRLYLGRPGPATARLKFELPNGSEADGYAVVVDDQPETQPPARLSLAAAEMVLDKLPEGERFIHVRAHDARGWGPTTRHRLVIDSRPPEIGPVEPAPGARACPGVWRCELDDSGSGVAPYSIDVGIDGKHYGTEHPAIAYDSLAGELQVDLSRLGVRPKPGAAVEVSVTAADENRVALPKPFSASFVFDPALDREGPVDPSLALRLAGPGEAEAVPGEGSFEYGLDDWRSFTPGSVLVERTDRTAASGRYSVRLMCTENASPFSAFVRRTPFDAARYRIVSFDYKVPDRLRVDFLLRFQDRYLRVKFTDRDQDDSVIGEVPVTADDQWHHAEFNLYDMLVRRFPKATDFTVQMLLLSGGPWSDPRRFPGNYAGTEYFIDNFHLVPMVGADTALQWSAADLTGVAGAEVITAASPDGLPAPDAVGVGRKVAGSTLALESLAQGMVYLWARLFDERGNRSRPLTMRLLIDAGRPKVGAVWPADGTRAAPATVGVELKDEEGAGLDLESLRLSVNSQRYALDHKVLSYDGNRLVWDGRRADVPVVFRDGDTVSVVLEEARDMAGNRPTTLPSWRFTMDYKADRRGPEVEVSSRTHPANLYETFDGPAVRWQPAPAEAARLSLADDGRGEGGQALLISPAGKPYAIWSNLEHPYAASRFGLVAFDYRLNPGTQLDLLVRARDVQGNSAVRAVTITDAATDLPRLGAVEGATADGAWHQAVVPLQALLAKDQAFRVPYIVEQLGFGDQGEAGKAGQPIAIDNVMVFREATSWLGRVSWAAYDETGVRGYSFVLDGQPRTVPEPKVMETGNEASWRDLPAGYSYFHIRAVDGAGNWGPTAHFLMKTPAR